MTSSTIAFLGPEGTFTAEAADRVAPEAERLPVGTIPEVFSAVREGRSRLGIVPIENLIEGSVNATLDELAFGPPGAYVRGELLLAVSMKLLVKPGASVEDIQVVRSHPHGLAQCRGWLARNLPQAIEEAATSTAEAARTVADLDPDAGRHIAAIGTALAGERFGLEVAVSDIHDVVGNTTRFAVLGRKMAAATGTDKTSVVVFFGEDRPGLLLRVLDEFALRGVNLTKIESRPTKQSMGEYCILIDLSGHLREARVSAALRSIHRHVAEVRILGSYRRADAATDPPEPYDAEDAYAEARDWYATILAEVD